MSSSNGKDFAEVVDLIRKEDPRFDRGAYFFVRQALDYTLKGLKQKQKQKERKNHHVTGQELLAGIREYALDQYGPMALALLEIWNVRQCKDFGDIVFNLVDYGVLGKTESDTPRDFEDGYSFYDAFAKPFLPVRSMRAVNQMESSGDDLQPG